MQQRHEGRSQLRGMSRKEMYFLRRPTVTRESKVQSGRKDRAVNVKCSLKKQTETIM